MKEKIIEPEKISPSNTLKRMFLNFCIGFTVFMLISMVFGMIFADESAKGGILICWEIAGTMLATTVLQMLFFTPALIKRLGYIPRLAAFGLSLYALLAICGIAFGWFPADSAGAWAGFTIAYLVILALMTVVFTVIYRRNIKELNDSLQEFKAKI